jgi:cobalt/nickel transport system permease protein
MILKPAVLQFQDAANPSLLDAIDPRCRVICSLLCAAALASVRNFPALTAGSALPLLLLCLDGRRGVSRIARVMLELNKLSVLVILFLPLTYTGERVLGIVSLDGVRMALVMVWKMNLISVVLLRMTVSMGMPLITDALGRLGLSEKLRMLLLLTMRYVFLLADRVGTMSTAVGLRAPNIRGAESYKAFAFMVGTTLVHSADRSERCSLAIGCRGGISGFSQLSGDRWMLKDTVICSIFFINSVCVWAFSLSFK